MLLNFWVKCHCVLAQGKACGLLQSSQQGQCSWLGAERVRSWPTFPAPGSPVCLLWSRSVALAELPLSLICSQRNWKPSSNLNGQPREGFFHRIVFHWCYTVAPAEACGPCATFPIINMTERTHFITRGAFWGAVPSSGTAQTGPPVLDKRLLPRTFLLGRGFVWRGISSWVEWEARLRCLFYCSTLSCNKDFFLVNAGLSSEQPWIW